MIRIARSIENQDCIYYCYSPTQKGRQKKQIDMRTALAFKRASKKYTGIKLNNRLRFCWLRLIDWSEERILELYHPPPDKWDQAQLNVLNTRLEDCEAEFLYEEISTTNG